MSDLTTAAPASSSTASRVAGTMMGSNPAVLIAASGSLRPWPVLVVTAEPDKKQAALDAGARDFVSKPFDPVEVLTRIRNLIEVRLNTDWFEVREQLLALRVTDLLEDHLLRGLRADAALEVVGDLHRPAGDLGVRREAVGIVGSGVQRHAGVAPQVASTDLLQTAPADVQSVAKWAVSSRDNRGAPFLMVDKPTAQAYVFNGAGQLLATLPGTHQLERRNHK